MINMKNMFFLFISLQVTSNYYALSSKEVYKYIKKAYIYIYRALFSVTTRRVMYNYASVKAGHINKVLLMEHIEDKR